MVRWNAETAQWYANKYGEYATNRIAVHALELAPNATIVDVGCGTGAALRHAAPRVPGGALIGVDPVPRMVEIARECTSEPPEGGTIEYREGPAEALPVDDNAADVVLAFDSFDHWQDPQRGLAEVRRVLKPAGQLVVVKDGGIGDGREEGQKFLDELGRAGFEVEREQQLQEQEVTCTMWVCRIAK